jgi:predicted transcriptional regulator
MVQDADNPQRLAYSVPLVVATGLQDKLSLLNQPTRLEIYNFIKNNPGVHFRGVCNSMDLPVGVVQYHLGVLENAGLVRVYDDGQLKRYFESNTYTAKEVKLISLLRHETTGKILADLSQNTFVLHKDLARNLGVSPQALSWQMNQLKKTGLIETAKEGINVKYSLNGENASEIRLLLNVVGKSQM